MTRLAKKGFTLAELLLTAAILAFVLSSLLVSFMHCLFLNVANRNLSTAVTHAEYVLEEIKNTDFTNIATNINNRNWDWDSVTIANKGLSALSSEYIDTQVSGTDLLDVWVTVSWKDRGIRDRNLTLETLIAKP